MQVSKSVPIIQEFIRLCNDIARDSFDADRNSVDFQLLDSSRMCPVGLFGQSDDVWKAMIDLGVAE